MSIVPHPHFLLDLPIAIFRFVINFQNRGQPTRGAEKKKRRNVSVLHARAWWLRTLESCRTASDEIARRDMERRFLA